MTDELSSLGLIRQGLGIKRSSHDRSGEVLVWSRNIKRLGLQPPDSPLRSRNSELFQSPPQEMAGHFDQGRKRDSEGGRRKERLQERR